LKTDLFDAFAPGFCATGRDYSLLPFITLLSIQRLDPPSPITMCKKR